jgi:hypothetical protein
VQLDHSTQNVNLLALIVDLLLILYLHSQIRLRWATFSFSFSFDPFYHAEEYVNRELYSSQPRGDE